MKKMHLKNLFLLFFITAVALISGCKKNSTELADYSEIKTADWRTKIGTEFTVEGYYDEVGGIGKIYNDPEDAGVDGPTRENKYLWIYKPIVVTHVPDYSGFIGRKVRIKGNLLESTDPSLVTTAAIFGDPSLAGIRVSEITFIDSVSYFRSPIVINDFCRRFPAVCESIISPVQTKVALLYSGGINSGNAHHRYWNDIYTLHKILVNQFGFSEKNIIVVYKAGVADDHADEAPVDYPATKAGLNSALSDLRSKMGASTKFFCFINNHGGGYETSTGDQYGITDLDDDDTRAGVTDHNTDEVIYYYNDATTFSDDSLAAKINTLTFGTGIFLLKPCFSGGLVWDLSGANRVLIAAGTEFEVTHAHAPEYNFGDLTFHFMAAITGNKPDGSGAVDADLNDDGDVSMYEAFKYINIHHRPDDHPQYEDDPDGYSTTTPSSTGLGSTVFL
ncbi:MAG: caspase family protein [Sphingobacteriales bacterium]|nr:caspase family protein [Sphingobacteriales bacterium]